LTYLNTLFYFYYIWRDISSFYFFLLNKKAYIIFKNRKEALPAFLFSPFGFYILLDVQFNLDDSTQLKQGSLEVQRVNIAPQKKTKLMYSKDINHERTSAPKFKRLLMQSWILKTPNATILPIFNKRRDGSSITTALCNSFNKAVLNAQKKRVSSFSLFTVGLSTKATPWPY